MGMGTERERSDFFISVTYLSMVEMYVAACKRTDLITELTIRSNRAHHQYYKLLLSHLTQEHYHLIGLQPTFAQFLRKVAILMPLTMAQCLLVQKLWST